MTRKQLKELSWEQIQGKIARVFLVTLIIAAIVSAVSSMISFPQQILSIFIDTWAQSIDNMYYITEEEAMGIMIFGFCLAGISFFLAFIQIIIQCLITGPFNFSTYNIFLKITNNKDFSVGDAFSGFKTYKKAVGVYFYQMLFTTLWSFLFIVPGFVKAFAYSMAGYISLENPELSSRECITRSKEMMKGHKWELFMLNLSFIGWILLTIVSCGIAGIWYIPYCSASHANFYRQLKGEI